MKRKKLLFIVNPGSGKFSRHKISDSVVKVFPGNEFETQINITGKHGDATRWSKEAVNTFDAVIAAGGDGTVNECASGLLHSDTALGIIPIGSGNGFARHIHIAPHRIEAALYTIRGFNAQVVDTGSINGKLFLSNAGCGFIANVADAFTRSKSKSMRGFTGYSIHTLSQYLIFTESFVQLTADGIEYDNVYFAVNICNTSQFGYNARVAPTADIKDGYLELVLVQKKAKWKYPLLLWPLFTNRFHKTRGIHTIKCRSVELSTSHPALFHIDGDPVILSGKITATLNPSSLRVIVP